MKKACIFMASVCIAALSSGLMGCGGGSSSHHLTFDSSGKYVLSGGELTVGKVARHAGEHQSVSTCRTLTSITFTQATTDGSSSDLSATDSNGLVYAGMIEGKDDSTARFWLSGTHANGTREHWEGEIHHNANGILQLSGQWGESGCQGHSSHYQSTRHHH